MSMNGLNSPRRVGWLFAILILTVLLSACGGDGERSAEIGEESVKAEAIVVSPTVETATPEPTNTAVPTDTPEPTATLEPTNTPTPTLTDTPEPTATPTHTPTPTPLPDLLVDAESVNVRTGPGVAYDVVLAARAEDELVVVGQAYDCAWLKVETANGREGWITGAGDYVTLNLACDEVAQADIPPTPTPAGPPTATPDTRPTVQLMIVNQTGSNMSVVLTGPANYNFTVPPGDHVYTVVAGTYSYSVHGCGGASASGTFTINEDQAWVWSCG